MKSTGTTHFFNPDTTQKRDVLLTRKFYIRTSFTGSNKPVTYGGQFQGSNNKSFKNPTVLHTITEEPTLRYKEVKTNSSQAFKYIRYQSPDSSWCSMAEIEFYSDDSTKLEGNVIGTEEHYKNLPKFDKKAVFDNDPITWFWSENISRPWVGLELKKPEIVQRIRYLLYNDDNDIWENDLYELFYYDVNNGFISLGKQNGNREQVLIYNNVPENAILWLRDYIQHTKKYQHEQAIYLRSINRDILHKMMAYHL